MVIFGESQTVSVLSVADTSGGYGGVILGVSSPTRALVGAITYTFTKVLDGMKLYTEYHCAIEGDSGSPCAVNIRINDNGTSSDVDESECQTIITGDNRLVTGLTTYTVAHCGTTGAGTVVVSLMGRRVVGSGQARVLSPILMRSRLARD